MSKLRDEVTRWAEADPGAPSIVAARGLAGRGAEDPEALTVTRARVAASQAKWQEGLDAAGVPMGARVGISGREPVALALAWLGILAAGRVVAPTPPDLTGEARNRWQQTVGPRAVLDTSTIDPLGLEPLAASLSAARVPTAAAPAPAVQEPAGGVLLTSSGTTGPPKLVALTEAQLLHTAGSVIAAHRLTQTDRCLNPLPLWHINAEVVALLGTVLSGGCLVLDDRFHRSGFWQLVETSGATWLNAVPAILAILGREEVDPRPGRLRFARSASAALPTSVREAFTAATGVPVVATYGMTEAASQITAEPLPGAPDYDPVPGGVGLPIGVELQVVGADGASLPPGTAGRVRIRGAGVITAYASAAGAEHLSDDGWLDTGDLGCLSSAGSLVLQGRSDDVINRGGEKVSPLHVEDELLRVAGVDQIAVVGVPDEILTQVPVAVIVAVDPDGDAEQLAAAVLAHASDALPRPSVPVRAHVLPSLLAGVNGKVSRKALARHLADAGLEAAAEVVGS